MLSGEPTIHPKQLPMNLNRSLPFQVAYYHRNTILRRDTHHHMNMIRHRMPFQQLDALLTTPIGGECYQAASEHARIAPSDDTSEQSQGDTCSPKCHALNSANPSSLFLLSLALGAFLRRNILHPSQEQQSLFDSHRHSRWFTSNTKLDCPMKMANAARFAAYFLRTRLHRNLRGGPQSRSSGL